MSSKQNYINAKKDIKDLVNSEDFKQFYDEESARLEFALKIKRLINKLNISQEELAEKMHVKPSYVSRIINGKSDFTMSTLYKICSSLGVRLELVV